MFRRVLVGTDLSPASEAVIDCLPHLRPAGLQEVVLAYVVQVSHTPGLEQLLIESAGVDPEAGLPPGGRRGGGGPVLRPSRQGDRIMPEQMNRRTRELVGIAAAVAGHCRPSFAYHCREGLSLGLPREQIQEAIKLAQAIRRAGDEHMDSFVARHRQGGGRLRR